MPVEGKQLWGVAIKIVVFVRMKKDAEQQSNSEDKPSEFDEEDKWGAWIEREEGEKAPGIYNRIEIMWCGPSKAGRFLFSNAVQLGDRYEGLRPTPLNHEAHVQQPVKAGVVVPPFLRLSSTLGLMNCY